MNNGLSSARYQEADDKLNHMENYLLELAQEIHESTPSGSRYNYTWLQIDSTLSYTRSLRAALQRESIGRFPLHTSSNR